MERTADLMLPVMAAIAVAHEQGVVHRDLKPENIFLATSGYGGVVPKVLDFGISKVLDEAQRMALTGTAVTLGTAYYLPPEQLRGSKQADARGDQYALGAILYECLTGRRAFEGESLYAVLKAVGDGTYAPLTDQRPDVPAALDAAINRAMALNPPDRFDSVRQLGFALGRFASPAVRALWQPFFDVAAPGMSTAPLGAPPRQATPAPQVVPRGVSTAPPASRRLTTLDGASGEPSPEALQSTLSVSRRKLPLLAALAAAAVVAVVVAAMRREQPRHDQGISAAAVNIAPIAPAAPAAPAVPPQAAPVETTATNPAGAAAAAAAVEPVRPTAAGAPDAAAAATELAPVTEKAPPPPARRDKTDGPPATAPAAPARPRRVKAEVSAAASSDGKAPKPSTDTPTNRQPNKAPIVE